jgi:chromosome segregation ATPase
VKNTLEQRRAHLRQAEEAKAVEGAQGLRAQLQALQESNKLLNENLGKAARARQEVEEKLLGQQKQLLDQAEATRQQLNAAQKENEQLRQAAQAQQADLAQLNEQLARLQVSNEGLGRTVEELRAERDRSAAGARMWVRVAVVSGIVCVVGWAAVVLAILAR